MEERVELILGLVLSIVGLVLFYFNLQDITPTNWGDKIPWVFIFAIPIGVGVLLVKHSIDRSNRPSGGPKFR